MPNSGWHEAVRRDVIERGTRLAIGGTEGHQVCGVELGKDLAARAVPALDGGVAGKGDGIEADQARGAPGTGL